MFKLLYKEGNKRLGILKTKSGFIITPAFGPDATRGNIKFLSYIEFSELSETTSLKLQTNVVSENSSIDLAKDLFLNDEIQFILTNTYHMTSYPGAEFIQEMGGIHKFMKWNRPILTDSGGFQVFSLIHASQKLKGKVTDDGAFFTDPTSGTKVTLTPESAIEIQFKLDSDIMVVLDDCRHYQDHKELKKSVYRTIEWAKRCKKRFDELVSQNIQNNPSYKRPLLFSVIQGGTNYELRKYCVEKLLEIDFDGYGFGGWAINEKEYFPYDLLEYVAKLLPENKPRYAMGVGSPENIIKCIEYGYDLFDCVIPSRNGRHGLAYTTQGQIKINQSKYKRDKSPLDPNLKSQINQIPRYYIHHLFKTNDPAGGRILTIQNLKYYNYLIRTQFTNLSSLDEQTFE